MPVGDSRRRCRPFSSRPKLRHCSTPAQAKPRAHLRGAPGGICQVNAACQTTPYVRQGRYLASFFIPVWRTTYNPTAGFRGMNANIDIQRQFCA
jgi:hypothetical protein